MNYFFISFFILMPILRRLDAASYKTYSVGSSIVSAVMDVSAKRVTLRVIRWPLRNTAALLLAAMRIDGAATLSLSATSRKRRAIIIYQLNLGAGVPGKRNVDDGAEQREHVLRRVADRVIAPDPHARAALWLYLIVIPLLAGR